MEPRSIWHKCGECGRDLNSPNINEVCPECGAKMIACNDDGSDMSQDEFVKREIESLTDRMRSLKDSDDQECAHSVADWILCEVLEKLGYKDLVDAFDDIDKWYA